MDAMEKITKNELMIRLLGVDHAAPCSVVTRTEADVKKNPYGKIFKVSRLNGMVGINYKAAVERRQDEKHVPGETWHRPVEHNGHLTPLCIHKTKREKIYLRLMITKVLDEPIYFDKGGDELSKDQVKPYLKKKPDRVVAFNVYDLDNIIQISIDGDKYEVV